MKETIDLFLDLNDVHWSGSAYQWFFYAGILLTLLLEKRRMLRIVFGWLPLLYLVFMFNPLCIRLMNLAGLYNKAYFIRLFSFMPLMYVIARGFTMILRIDNGWLKLIGTGAACAVICIAGKNIYLEDWLVKAENYEKVPKETLEILDAIKAEDNQNVSIAAINASAVYLRQVANVVTPYGRVSNALRTLLSSDQPDVFQIMQAAGQQDVDFLAVRRKEATLAAFLKYRYRPFAMTRDYAIYRVEGAPRMRRIFNEKRQIVSTTNYDATGAPKARDVGCTTVAYDYDTAGRMIGETYWNRDGSIYSTLQGYHSIRRTYYLDGAMKTIAYLDRNDKPIVVGGRYKTAYVYNSNGEAVKETYYDVEDNIIAEVGEGLPTDDTFMRFYDWSKGAKRDGNEVCFETRREGNRFNLVLFQLWDGVTGEHLLNFGEGDETGPISGEYTHQMPSGLYRIVFKGNTNLADEVISSLEYLTEGETIYYSYHIDELQEQDVKISNLYISRNPIG